MDIKQAKEKMMALQAKASAYTHALGSIYYDAATVAPKETSSNRAHSMGILNEELYKLMTGEETVELLEFLDSKKEELTEKERRMVFLMLKDLNFMKKIPIDEYIAYQELRVKAEAIWHKAKEADDFEMFEPYLKDIFETNRRFAKYCEPDKDPYDYWLNEFEEGASKEYCDSFFNELKNELVPLIAKISNAQQVDDSFLHGHFDKAKQEELAYYLMKTMGIDLDHCGLGVTEHPFTESLGSHHDVRITTNYQEDFLASSLYSVVHEGGHALYDLHSEDDLAYTVLDGGVSMGIHESQSRFYENLLGRSKEFITLILPKLKELFPEQLKDKTVDEVYKAINLSRPSLIRTEADEVTYCLHIMVRYELEKRVMSGELDVHDLPSEWNKLYKEYLGVDVPDDKNGVLQDTHWSGGAIGYFPSYALGSAYGAQLLEKMSQSVDVKGCIESGNFAPINEWNNENIWKYGRLYSPNTLLTKALDGEFSAKSYVDYLKKKYSDIYGFTID